MSHVLVINSGSSSLKYQLVDPADGSWAAKGLVERIGEGSSRLRHEMAGVAAVELEADLPDHGAALELVLATIEQSGPGLGDLLAVGHRVVHGGANYREPTIVDDHVESEIERIVPLAPLHNPASLVGIRELRRLLPGVPHVVVFDTAFHATMPPEAYTYALPTDLAARLRLRRYGFHGTSYRYVTRRSAELLDERVDQANLIICHLGNGASMAAVRDGVGVDTSMGLTPLQGLVMGTRSGDIDPAAVFHMVRVGGLSLDEVDVILNRESGLKGLAGDQDMREVRRRAEVGDERATPGSRGLRLPHPLLRRGVLRRRPGLQALVFTAGIGENDADLRRDVCRPLRHLGIHLDEALNAERSSEARFIDDGTGSIRIMVVPTNEEAEIARQAAEAVTTHR